jgi:aminoglycoside 3-N-acetyltransferase
MGESSKPVITKNDIINGLKTLGLSTGDVVIVHCSLSSMGDVKGGAGTLIDALLETVGDQGTVVMPTFSQERPFNKESSPTFLGRVSESFRTRKSSVRSLHPLVPVSAVGKDAGYIVAGHEKCVVPQGPDSPYGKINELDGKILLLGVDLDRCTSLHICEILANAPYLTGTKGSYLDENGKIVEGAYKQFPGPHRDFIGLTRWFIEAGIVKEARIGKARAWLMNSKEVIDEGMKAMAIDPAAVLCENPECNDCIAQRKAIYRQSLKSESFTLSVVSDLAGRYLDEIIENLDRYGIEYIELFHIQGKELFELAPDEIDHIFNRLKKADKKVSGIKISNGNRLDSIIKIAEKYDVNAVIIPMNENWTGGVPPNNNDVQIVLENINQLASETRSTLEEGFGLAFNPSNFARVKEKPFLQSLTTGRIKKFIRQLYINDSTFAGAGTSLAGGNAEIKELISILRYSGFDGYFVLEGNPGEIDYFQQAATLFEILDEL